MHFITFEPVKNHPFAQLSFCSSFICPNAVNHTMFTMAFCKLSAVPFYSVPLSLLVACEALSICQIHFLWLQICALHPALIMKNTRPSFFSSVQRILASHKLSRPPIDKWIRTPPSFCCSSAGLGPRWRRIFINAVDVNGAKHYKCCLAKKNRKRRHTRTGKQHMDLHLCGMYTCLETSSSSAWRNLIKNKRRKLGK